MTVFETHGHIQGTGVSDARGEKVAPDSNASKWDGKVTTGFSSDSGTGTVKRRGSLTR